LLRLNPPCET